MTEGEGCKIYHKSASSPSNSYVLAVAGNIKHTETPVIAETNKKIDETNKKIDETNKKIDETSKKIDETSKKIDETNKMID
jgi:septal ring factor EnvC (AmiA/AmiB activator)